MSKRCTAAEAVSLIRSGDTILMAGFYGYGSPPDMIRELLRQGQKDLTVVANEGA